MKLEKVNKDTLRVFISQEDLKNRGMESINLLGNQEEVEAFFFSILDEVDAKSYFGEGEMDMITFQARPLGNTLELLITRNSLSQEEVHEGKMPFLPPFVEELLSQRDEDGARQKLKSFFEKMAIPEDLCANEFLVLELESFEDAILMSKEIPKRQMTRIQSDLYEIDGIYLMVFRFLDAGVEDEELLEEMKDHYARLAEFGWVLDVHPDYLEEYGKLLMKENALETIKKTFKS